MVVRRWCCPGKWYVSNRLTFAREPASVSFNVTHFSSLVTEVLTRLELYSLPAHELLLGTCAVESDFGTNLYQFGGGPGSSGKLGEGVFSIEPETELSIWADHLFYKPDRLQLVKEITGVEGPSTWALRYRVDYGIIMARLKYIMIPYPLPPAGKLGYQADYWDRFYNCNPDYGTPLEYIKKYQKYVLGNS